MNPRLLLLKYLAVALLGCLIGAGITTWHFYRLAKEELVGRTSVAALNDLAHIAMIGNNNQAKAKYYMEAFVVQDLRLLSEHSKDKGDSGRLSIEALRRAALWRDQHTNLSLTPELQAELSALKQ